MTDANTPCVVIEVTHCNHWAAGPAFKCRRIPADTRPTVLHPNRKVAETEALRLAGQHRGRCFAVFEAASMAMSVELPASVNIHGQTLILRQVPNLIDIGDKVPF